MSEHEVWNELGNLYFVSGMLDQASYAYNRSIKLQERFGLPYSNLAYIKLQQGDFAKAAELYKQGIELLIDDRDKAISWYRLGDVFRRLKNYRDAIMAYQQADTLDTEACETLEGSRTFLYGSSDIQVDKIPSILDSQSRMDGGEAPQQDIYLEQVVLISNESTGDNIDEATFLEQEPEAIKEKGGMVFQETMFEISPVDPAQFSVPVEEIPESTPPYEDASPCMTESLDEKNLIYIDLASMNSEVSPLQLETISEVGGEDDLLPQNENSFCVSNSTLVDEKDMNLCGYVGDEEVANEVDPNEEPADIVQEVDYIHKQLEEKVERLEGEIKKDLRNAKKWSELASVYKSAGMYDKSIEAIQRAVMLYPNTSSYIYELGVTYGVVGRHEDAINCMEKVLKIDPQHGLAHASLSGYYRKKGLTELAEKHLSDAMKNYIDDENLYNRACLEALKGNVEQAVGYLREALEERQIQVEWVLRDPDLDAIRFTQQFKGLIAEFAG